MIETHLVLSKTAELTLAYETDRNFAAVRALADKVYAPDDLAAAVSSGSFQTIGMIVAPCSVKTLAEIATGVTTTLISRAADVTLKERRRLVLMVRGRRFTPAHQEHAGGDRDRRHHRPAGAAMYAQPRRSKRWSIAMPGPRPRPVRHQYRQVMRWGGEEARAEVELGVATTFQMTLRRTNLLISWPMVRAWRPCSSRVGLIEVS